MQNDVAQARQTRQERVADRQDLVARLEEILFRHDPIGINFEHNTDEYRPEAETISLRIGEAASEHDLQRIIHEEFVRWFDDSIAGPAERYAEIAREAWQIGQNGQ
ncbi:MAG TPA: hypothetical protein VJ914_07490 [Pseudonocardiaceae bacterium]|nr:hypothetical protein [Pseudonocardiaceae bacterium]